MKNERIISQGKRVQKRIISDDLDLSKVFHKKLKLSEDLDKLDNESKLNISTMALILYKEPSLPRYNSGLFPKKFIKNLENRPETVSLNESIVLPKIHLDIEKLFELEAVKEIELEESEENFMKDLDINYMELDWFILIKNLKV